MKEIKVRLNADAICDGLLAVKDAYRRAYQDFDIVFTEGEYGTGQHKLSVSVRNLLSDAVSLIKDQHEQIQKLTEEKDELFEMIKANKEYYSGNDGNLIL